MRLKGGVIDRGERGDQNALGFTMSIGLMVIEKCTINCLDIIVRVPPCMFIIDFGSVFGRGWRMDALFVCDVV